VFKRVVFFVSGLALIHPAWWTDLFGLVPIALEWKSIRRIIAQRYSRALILLTLSCALMHHDAL